MLSSPSIPSGVEAAVNSRNLAKQVECHGGQAFSGPGQGGTSTVSIESRAVGSCAATSRTAAALLSSVHMTMRRGHCPVWCTRAKLCAKHTDPTAYSGFETRVKTARDIRSPLLKSSYGMGVNSSQMEVTNSAAGPACVCHCEWARKSPPPASRRAARAVSFGAGGSPAAGPPVLRASPV